MVILDIQPIDSDKREDIFESCANQYAEQFYASNRIKVKSEYTATTQMLVEGHLP